MAKQGTSKEDYGYPIHLRDHFICEYCGFDGRPFDNWMQLSIDHIRPVSSGGDNSDENKITACNACNSIMSRMGSEFGKQDSREAIIDKKRKYVAESRNRFFDFWHKKVAPDYLNRPLPKV